jgi:hypothetical protein
MREASLRQISFVSLVYGRAWAAEGCANQSCILIMGGLCEAVWNRIAMLGPSISENFISEI